MKIIPTFIESKFKEGEAVYAIINPGRKLIIRRFIDSIYYCQFPDNPSRQDLAYLERELLAWEIKP